MVAWLFGLKNVPPAALHDRLGAVVVVDVNSIHSWTAAHVPQARRLAPLNFTAADLPAERTTPLVFYCSNWLCSKAPNAARRARQMGFSDVAVMSAGIAGWQAAGLPTASG
ncbi:rhodanese-like domain-containing protein [Massilia sp. PWRC2]|uniref:rhodanese-like domain-containing protein n=1 Tax=Massilia sp. PWRC2 TaxID=2804626 RepID=UPI003CEF421D